MAETKAETEATSEQDQAQRPANEEIKPRRRGRPPGSTNKKAGKKPSKRRLVPAALDQDYTPESEGKLYHYGICPDSPLQRVTVGGVSFCDLTYRPSTGQGRGQPLASQGIITRLSEESVDAVLSKIQHRVVRIIPRGAADVVRSDGDYEGPDVRTEILNPNADYYRRTEWDEPLCDHIYMIPEGHPSYNMRDGKLTPIGEMYADASE